MWYVFLMVVEMFECVVEKYSLSSGQTGLIYRQRLAPEARNVDDGIAHGHQIRSTFGWSIFRCGEDHLTILITSAKRRGVRHGAIATVGDGMRCTAGGRDSLF